MVLERVGSPRPPPSISLTSFLLPTPPPPPARSTHPTSRLTPSALPFSRALSMAATAARPPAVAAAPAAVATAAASSSSLPVAIIPVRLVLAPLPPPSLPLASLSPSTLILSQPKLSGGEKRSWQEGMYAPSLPSLPFAGLMNQLIKVYGFTHGGLSGTKSTRYGRRALQAWKRLRGNHRLLHPRRRGVI